MYVAHRFHKLLGGFFTFFVKKFKKNAKKLLISWKMSKFA